MSETLVTSKSAPNGSRPSAGPSMGTRYWAAPFNVPIVGDPKVVKTGARVEVTTKSGKVKNVRVRYAAKVTLDDGTVVGVGYATLPVPPLD